MCRACWEGDGAPRELPDNAAEVVDLIRELYAQPDGGAGGPLHTLLDDFNTDDNNVEPYYSDRYPTAPRTRELADRIAELMRPMTEDQRAAVIAEYEGWTKPPTQPERCPFNHSADQRPPVTHQMRYADAQDVVAWACAEHAEKAIAYQASVGVSVVAEPIPTPTRLYGAPSSR